MRVTAITLWQPYSQAGHLICTFFERGVYSPLSYSIKATMLPLTPKFYVGKLPDRLISCSRQIIFIYTCCFRLFKTKASLMHRSFRRYCSIKSIIYFVNNLQLCHENERLSVNIFTNSTLFLFCFPSPLSLRFLCVIGCKCSVNRALVQ